MASDDKWYRIVKAPTPHRIEKALFDPYPLEGRLWVLRPTMITIDLADGSKYPHFELGVNILGSAWSDETHVEIMMEGKLDCTPPAASDGHYFVAWWHIEKSWGFLQFRPNRLIGHIEPPECFVGTTFGFVHKQLA